MNQDNLWLKLDNAAKIYPASRTRRWTALFRLSAELDQPVDRTVLEKALMRVTRRMPGFALKLRRGFFWYYLEHLDGFPALQDDVANPCVRMDLKENDGFMFRVRVHHCRIAVEFFHVLSDGAGGFVFLKTLVAEYLSLLHNKPIPRSADILDCDQPPRDDELEDAFLKYARPLTMSRKEAVAYRLRGTPADPHFMHIISGVLPSGRLAALAKEHGATVGEFLSALLIWSVYRVQQSDPVKRRRRQPVKVCVPVNLRQFYPTRTLRNFASYVNPGIQPALGEYDFDEILAIVRHQIALEVTEKNLNVKFSTNVGDERNRLLRPVPLFIKNPVMRLIFYLSGDRNASTIISNLGRAQLPAEMAAHVKRLDFMLGSLSRTRVTCACVSYGENTVINFTRAIRESEVERIFFTTLVEMGVPVTVESNQRY
ncbi:MAG: hypothetical protein IJP03_06475 [Christensenellaceae bacterium]|nr:hypothetical protein [Christensenellaceae bacterium]